MFPGDVIGGFRRSLCFWAISGVFYAVCTLHYFKGMGKKQQQMKDCSGGGGK